MKNTALRLLVLLLLASGTKILGQNAGEILSKAEKNSIGASSYSELSMTGRLQA